MNGDTLIPMVFIEPWQTLLTALQVLEEKKDGFFCSSVGDCKSKVRIVRLLNHIPKMDDYIGWPRDMTNCSTLKARVGSAIKRSLRKKWKKLSSPSQIDLVFFSNASELCRAAWYCPRWMVTAFHSQEVVCSGIFEHGLYLLRARSGYSGATKGPLIILVCQCSHNTRGRVFTLPLDRIS